MGFFGFLKKRKDVPSISKSVPLGSVEELVGKGLSKRQIVDFLKSEGYSIDLIEKAFSQLESKQGVLSSSGAPVSEPQLPSLPDSSLNGVPELPLPEGEGLLSRGSGGGVDDSLEPDVEGDLSRVGNVEGLVEVIVEEKFAELVDKLEGFDDLKASVESRVDSFKSEIESFKSRLGELEKFRDETLSSYRRSLEEFRLEINAMEKAFQKLVPSLSANIRKMRESPVEKGKGRK